MKTMSAVMSILLCLFLATGCDRKEEPQAPAPHAVPPAEEIGLLDQAARTTDDALNAAKETATESFKDFTAGVNLDKSVSALKAEAEKMDVQSLRQVAMKYKDAIVEKQDELSVVSSRLADIPMAQRLGEEARTLAAEAEKLTGALASLKERYDVYIAAIQQHGGDLSGLLLQ